MSSLYLFLYFIVTIPSLQTSYTVNTASNTTELFALIQYLKADPVLFVFAFCVRLFYLVRNQSLIDPTWDSLPVGIIFYFFIYIKLRFVSLYYMAPVDFMAILYLNQKTRSLWGLWVFFIVFFCLSKIVRLLSIKFWKQENLSRIKLKLLFFLRNILICLQTKPTCSFHQLLITK